MSFSGTSHRRPATIAVACIATAMLVLDISVINTTLPDIARGLAAGLGGLQWMVDAYTLPLAAVVLTAGCLADRFGRRAAFALGLVMFTGASAACGLSGSIAVLDGARAVQGAGAAILFAVSLALIAEVTPSPAERAKALALYGATIGGSFAAGPFAGGVLTQTLGWRAVFLVNVPPGLAALWLTLTRVAESRGPRGSRIDWPGQVTLAAGLAGLVLGLLRATTAGWAAAPVLISLIAGALLLAAFTAIELRSREPMLPLRLLGQRGFAGPQACVFAVSSSIYAIFLYLSLYLQGTLGLSPLATGLVYLPGSMLMLAVSAITPRLAARTGHGPLAAAGLGIITAALALMLLNGTHSGWAVSLPGIMLGFAGMGLFNPAISVIAFSALPEGQAGLAAGTYDTFRQAGIALGTAALGVFIPASGALGGARAAAYVSGLHHAELLAIAIAAAGTITAIMLIGRGRTYPPAPARPRQVTDGQPAGLEMSQEFASKP